MKTLTLTLTLTLHCVMFTTELIEDEDMAVDLGIYGEPRVKDFDNVVQVRFEKCFCDFHCARLVYVVCFNDGASSFHSSSSAFRIV
jgi:hypothetical protein